VSDHLLQGEPGTDPPQEMLEAYTVLGHLSAVTERIRLGVLVSPVTFREPALLVKAVATLDVLSGGRAWLGLGAGYHLAEAEMTGLPMPPSTRLRADECAEAFADRCRALAGLGLDHVVVLTSGRGGGPRRWGVVVGERLGRVCGATGDRCNGARTGVGPPRRAAG
jgi:alkanesulfonate monooxygenase SsuD/methylene tetrahydromethanopterin reductase-like flavin-dependent oxidoreductase (luciferase family)